MSDLLQGVLIIVAISSMPVGVILVAIVWLFAKANKKLIEINAARLDDVRTRITVLETICPKSGVVDWRKDE